MKFITLCLAGTIAFLCLTTMVMKAQEGSQFVLIAKSTLRFSEEALPDDEGKEEVEAYCGACHSLRLVIQQGLSREKWDELLDWMVEEQEMEELPADERKLVLDYLAKHVGATQHKQLMKQK